MKLLQPSLILVGAFGASVFCLPGQAESSVWKAEKGGSVVYLGGTCHVLRKSDYPLPAEFDQAYARADRLVFETDIGKAQEPAIQMAMLEKGRYQDGMTLKKVLSEETYSALEEHCRRAGVPLAMLNHLKPSLAMVMLASMEMVRLGFLPEGVDLHFQKRAEADGKPVEGLEELSEQIDMLLKIGSGNEDQFVAHTLRDIGKTGDILETLVASWRAGDNDALERLLTEEIQQNYPKLYQELLVDRNRDWLPKIEALFKTDQIEFVLVGTGHLIGEEGVLAMLEDRGYAIEAIKAEKVQND